MKTIYVEPNDLVIVEVDVSKASPEKARRRLDRIKRLFRKSFPDEKVKLLVFAKGTLSITHIKH